MMKFIFVSILFVILEISFLYSQASDRGFIHREGKNLVLDGKTIYLRGVCFDNRFWDNTFDIRNYNSELDYRRIRDMGMNTVRFYMKAAAFEDSFKPYNYPEKNFEWLDKNVAWAKKHGVYIILDMQVPPGGYQPLGQGGALWNDPGNQERLISLWKAIANHYKNEPAIAGYDLLNEPMVTKSLFQWANLATNITLAIREVDTNHLIIVANMLRNTGEIMPTYELAQNFFPVPDENVMYTFHYYHPIDYTHQFTSWNSFNSLQKYPDDNAVVKLMLNPLERGRMKRNKAYLEYELTRMMEFGIANNFPLYVGEFGAYKTCYGSNGGIIWMRDLLDLMNKYGLNYTYHCYRESGFGIYLNDDGLPSSPREDLIQLFREKLLGTEETSGNKK